MTKIIFCLSARNPCIAYICLRLCGLISYFGFCFLVVSLSFIVLDKKERPLLTVEMPSARILLHPCF